MKKQLQISVSEPCHENWDNMTPDEKGRYCGACRKQVIDFTTMSDRQLAEFFKKTSTGSVCGRFMPDQLDRGIDIPKKRIPWIKYFFQFTLPAFLVTLKTTAVYGQKAQTAKNAVKKMNKEIHEPVYELLGDVEISYVDKTAGADTNAVTAVVKSDTITVKVVSENNDPVPFASIYNLRTGYWTKADENGIFVITASRLKINNVLSVSSAGFEPRELIISETDYSSGTLIIQLKTKALLPEVVINAPVTYVMGGAMSGIVIRQKNSNSKPALPVQGQMTIFPNPASSGASINLRYKAFDQGYYRLNFITTSGQLLQQQEIWIEGGTRLVNIDLPVLLGGIYFLVLTNNESGEKFTEKIIIQ